MFVLKILKFCMSYFSGLAIVYLLLTVPFFLPWGSKGSLTFFLSWCHLVGAVSPWIGSFLYHVFMNLDYDEVVYKYLLKLDMLGIWICQSFGKPCYFLQGNIPRQ